MNQLLKEKRYVPFLILLGVLIVPLLYSYFYLGAFWDPYSRLEKVPVAVVNEDSGAVINDKSRNVGRELCDKLKEDATLEFTFTDSASAKDGLKGTKYYAIITIPKNFSSTIASTDKATKEMATITYSSNEKRNYLASQILNSAVTKVEMSVRASIDEELVAALSNQLKETPDKLQTLSNGLGQLSNGANTLTTGTTSLDNGASALNDGAATLKKGASSLASGANVLKKGCGNLQSGSSKLFAGSTTLAAGLKTYKKKLTEFQSGLSQASSGSATLKSNLNSLQTGMSKLEVGVGTLNKAAGSLSSLQKGATALSSGSVALKQGVSSYTSGVNSLLSNVEATTQALAIYAAKTGDPTITKIVSGLTTKENLANLNALKVGSVGLNQAADKVTPGAQALATGTNQLTKLQAGISSLKSGITSANKGTKALATGSADLANGLRKLDSAGKKLTSASSKLSSGASSLNSGMKQLSGGIGSLDKGVVSLASGANKIKNGSSSLKDGTTSLLSGTTALQNGAKELTAGISKANSSVTDSIKTAKEQLPALTGLDQYAATPVTLTSEPYAPVPNYGTAFAPYFLSLSLWVGGLMIFFGIYFDPDRKFKLLSRNSNHPLKRTIVYLLIGLAQAVLLCFVLIIGLGLNVENLPLFFFGSCLVSLVFVTMIQLFLLFFKNVGKFLAIALLILQLTSCGGTFPMETVPKIFNHLFPFMPMTYSVGLFKEAISGTGDSALIMKNVSTLVGILVVTLAVTIILTIIKKKKSGIDLIEENALRPRAF